MKRLTQRERVHVMLKGAGPRGVRSDHFIKEHMPRAAARVLELKDEGIQIDQVREGKYVRYTLVGSSAGGDDSRKESLLEPRVDTNAHSSGTLFELEKPKPLYIDVWDDGKAA